MQAPLHKRCRQCNHPADLQAPQCVKCGHVFSTRFDSAGNPLPAEMPTQAFPQPFHTPAQAKPAKRKQPRWLNAALIAISALVIGVAYWGQVTSPPPVVRIIWVGEKSTFTYGVVENLTDQPLRDVSLEAIGIKDVPGFPVGFRKKAPGGEWNFENVFQPRARNRFFMLELKWDDRDKVGVFQKQKGPDGADKMVPIPFSVTTETD